ncbi:MAG: alpha/beta hydrolase [Bacteroidetes bacterium]|nr:alpha/beta hydrolase [Bacteroidota bacterium]
MLLRLFYKQLYFIFLFLCLSFNALHAQDSIQVIHLWEQGAPGFEKLKDEPELAKDWWVRNINNPSVTVYPAPKDIATGCAVIVCPGGGFLNIVYNAEGRGPAKFLNSLGITVFVLKYRLFRMDHSPYTQENPMQDIFRAIRLIKSRANEFHIDTAKLGVMGFSAGGEVAGWVSYRFKENHVACNDAIDKLSARPSFQILIYPGPLCVPGSVPVDSPPTFLLAANGDECCSEPIIRLVQMHRKANVPVEMHLYEKGAHAFNMGHRSEFASLRNWPQRLADWMEDNGWAKEVKK